MRSPFLQILLCLLFLFTVSAVKKDLFRSGYSFIPDDWHSVRIGTHLDRVTLYIAAAQQNLDKLDKIFWKVSDPKSADYGRFMSRFQVDNLIAPSTETINSIKAWLNQHRLSYFQPVPDWFVVQCSATEASKLLQVEFWVFEQKTTGLQVVKSKTPAEIPDSLAAHIDLIGGVTDFPQGSLSSYEKRVFSKDSLDGDEIEPVILYMLPGDTTLATFFLPICSNGLTTTNATGPCRDQGSVIKSVTQIVSQIGKVQKYTLGAEEMDCRPCTNWTSRQLSNCQSANSQYNLPNNTVYCNSPLLVNLKNYYQTNYSISLKYENGIDSLDADWTIRPLYLGEFVTPATLLSRYGVPPGREVCNAVNNSQSVAEFSGQYYSPSDLDYWFSAMNAVPSNVIVVGRNLPQIPGSEATLDIEFIMGVAQNVTTYFWNDGVTFLGWIVNVLNSQNPPLVHSVSYGGTESDYSLDFLTRTNTEFQKAGTIGLTIVLASGDSGVLPRDITAPPCTAGQQFVSVFPASSPYVTAVGATQFSSQLAPVCSSKVIGLPITCDNVGEIACSISTGSRITTGGGFSGVFSRPSYQNDVVAHYLATAGASVPAQYYNATGRAYPDVAACGRNFLVYISDDWDPVDGTSAAAPTVAALLTIANDYRLNNNLSPLGFVNPLLYQGVYNNSQYTEQYFENYWDILMGNNNCGTQGQACCPYGWMAARGWDAVSGLGSIRNLVQNSNLFPN